MQRPDMAFRGLEHGFGARVDVVSIKVWRQDSRRSSAKPSKHRCWEGLGFEGLKMAQDSCLLMCPSKLCTGGRARQSSLALSDTASLRWSASMPAKAVAPTLQARDVGPPARGVPHEGRAAEGGWKTLMFSWSLGGFPEALPLEVSAGGRVQGPARGGACWVLDVLGSLHQLSPREAEADGRP